MTSTDNTVVVTGGGGFLGSSVVKELKSRGYSDIVVPRSSAYDLTSAGDVERLYQDSNPDVILHLAGTVGGIGVMDDKPGEIFYDNAFMSLEVQEQARRNGVEKFVSVGSVCAYPKHTPVPFEEDSLWNGYPEETHAPYGIAKKIALVQSQAYRRQYDFDGIYLLPVNLYGPNDDFDLETSHVIPAIIRKVDRAMREGKDSITAWGTGKPTREFLYVEDAAEGIVEAAEKYSDSAPMNIGTSEEISIHDLVHLIKNIMGYDGVVKWDTSKPDGQPRRMLDTSRAEKEIGWTASTDFEEGLETTIEWYLENREDVLALDDKN